MRKETKSALSKIGALSHQAHRKEKAMIPLFDTWSAILKAHGVTESPIMSFTELINRHATPQRFYHTFFGHIVMVMEEFEPVRRLCKNPLVVEGFLKTHDSVYNSQAHDNEEQSALWMDGFFGRLGIAKDYRDQVGHLIVDASKTHIGIPGDTDRNAAISCDLAILGRPWEEYLKYMGDVGLEYAWVDEMYGTGMRVKNRLTRFLEPYGKRDPLFPHEYFCAKYEKQAKENMRREMDMILSGESA